MMPHGTRQAYQGGCKCRDCRCANAAYISHLRILKAKGQQPLGILVPAKDAARAVRYLLIEGFSQRRVAKEAGLVKRDVLQNFTAEQLIRLRTQLKLRRAYRMLILETNETNHASAEGS